MRRGSLGVLALITCAFALSSSIGSGSLSGEVYVASAPRIVSGVDRLCSPHSPPVTEKHEFSIQIDSLATVPTNVSKTVMIGGLSTEAKHLLRIRDFGKTVESFWFTFEQPDAPRLCLWYSEYYNTWSLWPAKEAQHFCKEQMSK